MKYVTDHNVLPVTWSSKCKSKTYWTIKKFKKLYCVRGDFYNILYIEPLNQYYQVLKWTTVRLIFILQRNTVFRVKVLNSQIPLPRKIFQIGSQSSLNFLGISGVMEDSVMLFSALNKYYMANLNPHTSGMKSYKAVCYITVFW